MVDRPTTSSASSSSRRRAPAAVDSMADNFQQQCLESDDPSVGTTTLSLTNGVLRNDQGQLIQLIAINSDGQQEYLDHTTLTHGDLITGDLPHGMIVNFNGTQLHHHHSQHEQIGIDALAGSDEDGAIVEMYQQQHDNQPPELLHHHIKDGIGIVQYAPTTAMPATSIGGGGLKNGAKVIVSNAYCNRPAKPRQTISEPPLELPPLAPFLHVEQLQQQQPQQLRQATTSSGRRLAAGRSNNISTRNNQRTAPNELLPAAVCTLSTVGITLTDGGHQPATQLPHKKRHTTVNRPSGARPAQQASASAVSLRLPVKQDNAAPLLPTLSSPPPPPSQFQCQLCSMPCVSQLDFFRHLQTHYELTPEAKQQVITGDADDDDGHEVDVKHEYQQQQLFDDGASDEVAGNPADSYVIKMEPRERKTTPRNRSQAHAHTSLVETSHIVANDDHPGDRHGEQQQHHIEFVELVDHQQQQQQQQHQHALDAANHAVTQHDGNNLLVIRLETSTGDVGAGVDDGHGPQNDGGECDVHMKMYTLADVDEQGNAIGEENGPAAGDESATVQNEWFEEGEMNEEMLFDVTSANAVNEIEVIPQQIDDDDGRSAHSAGSVAQPDLSDTSPVKTSPAPPTPTSKRKRTYTKKMTRASQMDCFEEIIAVQPAATDDGDGATATARRTSKRGAAASAAAGADSTDPTAVVPSGKPITTKSFKCRLCDKVCKTKNSLHYHFLLHTGERPHQCDECGKGFFANSALKVHQRLHTGDKPYTCEVCSRAFRQWGDLRYHMTSLHSDEKIHQCEFCGKDFARRYSLVIHRRIHTGERNYKCEYCEKSFRASTYLQDHRRIHTGEKPYECEFCQKKFRVRGDLKRHWNIHTRTPKAETTLDPLGLSEGMVEDEQLQQQQQQEMEGDEEGLVTVGEDNGDGDGSKMELVELLMEPDDVDLDAASGDVAYVEYDGGQFTVKAQTSMVAPVLETLRVVKGSPKNSKPLPPVMEVRKSVAAAAGGRNKRPNAAKRSQ